MTVAGEPAPAPDAQARSSQRVVLRNTLMLVFAQVAGAPLSMLINAVMGRYLGPEGVGHYYLATTIATFGFLVVEWGQGGTLPAMVATDRARAGVLLGSSLAWRAVAALGACVLLTAGAVVKGYGREFQVALALVCLATAIGTLGKSIRDVVRGFERADISAYSHVGGQVLVVVLVIPTLVMGGGLQAALLANLAASALLLVPLWRVIRPVGIGPLSVERETLRTLYREGKPFLVGGLIVTLQPTIDALILAELAPAEVVGWHGAARKLINVLVFPANALVGALYPTLCRLWVQDRQSYFETARSALRGATTLTVPVAVACFSFPHVGIQLFGEQSFAAAEDNLRVLAIFVLLVYLSMTLGTCLSAAGKQRPWTVAQVACVVVSVVADPILIPLFQRRFGNGGLGVAVASDVSEVLMFAAGAWLAPRGIFDRGVVRTLLAALLAGAAMAGVAHLLSGFTAWLAAPAAFVTYLAALLLTGGTDKQQLKGLLRMLSRRG